METKNSGQLQWEHKPFRELIRLGWPIAVSMVSYSVMTLVDTMFVGHLGADALAGVGLGAVLAFVTLVFGVGLVRAAKTLISQSIGAGKPEEYGAYLGAALLLGILYSLVALGIAQLLALWLGSGHADAAHRNASVYLHVRSLGAPLFIGYMALREGRYGKGDARSPMFATIVANIANIALNFLFVVMWKKGVAGSATATVLAQAIEALVLVYVQSREGFGVRLMRRAHVDALIKIGVPSGLQFALELGAFALLATITSTMGSVQMAAHQIALQVIHFSFLPAFALGEAASVLAGNAVGARREELVLKVARSAWWVAAAYTGACTIVFVVGATWIGSIFTDDVEVQHVVFVLLLIASAFQIADAANIVARGVLRGAGDVRVPALVGVVTAWLMSPPLAWLLGVVAHLGAAGAWLGLTAEIFLGAGFLWWRLLRGHWLAAARASRDAIPEAQRLVEAIPAHIAAE
ncbi:MAG: MATE family efflux transporter [Sandaracinaceae bacterium]|nr:MATE family efflux transporter [Sandaracinaceae bacterium]